MLKKTILFLLIVLSCIALFGACSNIENGVETNVDVPSPSGEFEFVVLKAGQADAIIMQTENSCVVVDCGEKDDGDEIVEYLKERNITKIDCVFVTHFDKDHIGGFPKVADNVEILQVIVPNYQGSGKEYEKYLEAAEQNKTEVYALDEDSVLVFDDVLFEISIPKKENYYEGDNDFSLAISVTHGENTFLFPGDAEAERTAEILSVFGKEHKFLKVPHHGNYNKNSSRLINIVKPEYAVVTDSDKNPADIQLMSLLEESECMTYSTSNGDVFVLSDGKTIQTNQGKD